MENPNRYGRPAPTRRPVPTFGGFSGTITCSYDELVRCFGKPTYVAKAHERVKTAMEWKLEDRATGNRFTVYEFKSTTRYSTHPSALSLAALRRLPVFTWNIGAGRLDPDALQRWISEKLGREVMIGRP